MDGICPRIRRCARTACLLAAMACGWSGFVSNAWADPPTAPEIRVARLIRDLGSRNFSERQAADDQLSRLGNQPREALEKALTDDDPEVRLRAERLLERLKLNELWSASSGRMQANGESASKILQALAERSGNHIHIGDPYGNFSDQKLDVDYQDATYWEVIDDICQRTGNRLRPHYDAHTPGIVVSAGTLGKFPRAYSGPVRAQITSARRVFIEELSYEERKTELTQSFQIGVQFSWEDRFRMVGYATAPELVEAVTDNHAVISAPQPAGSGWNATSRGLRQVTASLKLNPVPITAQSFDVLKLRWGLIAIGDPATIEVSDLALDRPHARDDVVLKIEAIEKLHAGKYVITVCVSRDLSMPEPHEVVFQEYETELFDQQNRPFNLQGQTQSLTDKGVQLKLTFSGESGDSEPESLKFRYPRLRARRDVELVFRNVPLPVAKPE